MSVQWVCKARANPRTGVWMSVQGPGMARECAMSVQGALTAPLLPGGDWGDTRGVRGAWGGNWGKYLEFWEFFGKFEENLGKNGKKMG